MKLDRNTKNGLLFASPWIFALVVFIAYPIASSLYYSFCDYDGIRSPRFTGLANYQLLVGDELFVKSILNTLYMVVCVVPLNLVLGLLLAMLLNQKVKGISLFRAFCYLPTITPILASSILWMWILNPELGLINTVLHSLGVQHLPGWLNDPAWSKPSLVVMGTWGVGGSMVIYLAALQNIPISLVEAASLDGASNLVVFRNVTLPSISPVIFFNLITGLIGAFQYFTESYVMTNGGPEDSTLFYALHLFNRAFIEFDLGTASAMAWVLFLITSACMVAAFKTSGKWVFYGGK